MTCRHARRSPRQRRYAAEALEGRRLLSVRTFSNTASIALPSSGAPLTLANTYPSAIDVSGYAANELAGKVTVRLNGLTHPDVRQLDVLLVSPDGWETKLISDLLQGGNGSSVGASNVTLTFDDDATATLPANGPVVGGTYKPHDFGVFAESEEYPAPGPGFSVPVEDARMARLEQGSPNGQWKLFVVDDTPGGGAGTLAGGWSLTIRSAVFADNATPITNAGTSGRSTFTPYPSPVTIAGVPADSVIDDVVVDLFGMNSSYPEVFDVLLVAPNGAASVLWSDAGGSQDLFGGHYERIDTYAPDPLPDNDLLTFYTHRPTNYGAGDVFNAPAPAAPAGGFVADFSTFEGLSPNGQWRLFVMNEGGGPVGALHSIDQGWRLELTLKDTTPPAPPAAIDLGAGSDSGVSSTDDLTNDPTPTLNGTADPGTTVNVYANLVFKGSAVATASGTWAVTVALAQGDNDITATAVDPFGNVSAVAAGPRVVVDTTAPAAPTLAPDLFAASDTGSSYVDNVTNDSTPTLRVSVAAPYHRLMRGATRVSDLYATGDFTEPSPVADGVHNYTALAVDDAGNVSAASPALPVLIDTLAPAAPAAPDLAAASDGGVSGTDNVTNDRTPTLSVALSAGASYYRLFRGGSPIADYATGTFTEPASLADGVHAYTARSIDLAGNVSAAASAAASVTVDGTAPTASPPTFRFETGPQAVVIDFSELVQPSLTLADLAVARVGGGGAAAPGALSYAAGDVATFAFPGVLADGNYAAQLAAPGVTDVAGNPLAAGLSLSFHALAGDANRDRRVNFSDLLTLAQNYGQAGRTFSQGDFDYSGTVNFADLLTLAQRYGTTLAAGTPTPATPGAPGGTAEGRDEDDETPPSVLA